MFDARIGAEYGDRCSVAASKATTFYLITDPMDGQVQILSKLKLIRRGYTEQPAQLSPTGYTVLYVVCRTRVFGFPTQQLGVPIGYDPHTKSPDGWTSALSLYR